jgi:predicted PurR-regulated permease PerM
MSDLISPPTSTNGAATPSFWQRITNKQVAIGTVLVAMVLLSLGLIVALRYVFLMLFLGIVVATALTPVVDRLRKFGLAQGTATLMAFGALLLILGGIAAVLAPFFVDQFIQALTDLPKFYAGFRSTISSSDSQFLRGVGAQLPADPFSGLASEEGIALGSQITLLLPSLASTLLFTALVIILSYYWLYYRALAIQSIALLVPINQRAGAVELWNEIETKIGAFVRGLAILGFVIGLLSAIGYMAIGLPYGLTIAVIAGILEAIPYVGPLITLALAGLSA